MMYFTVMICSISGTFRYELVEYFAVRCFIVNRPTGRNLRRLYRPFSLTRQTESECSGTCHLPLSWNVHLKTTKYVLSLIN